MTLDPTASSNRAYNRGNYYENCIYKGPITAVFNLVSSKKFQDAQNSTCKLRKRKGRNRILEEVYGEYFSTLKTIIANHDLSKVIVSGSINVLQILQSVARIAQVEVYKSRILSFHSMKSGFLLEALNWEYFQEVSSFIKPVVMQQCNLKSIRSVSYFVLSYITSNVASSFDKLSLTSPVPSKLVLLCTKLAEITERFLGSISLEEELFVLPNSQREFLEAHFGTISPAQMIIDESREDMSEIEEIFTQVNELLRENERELMKEVDYMKYRKIILQGVVKQDFRVLQICDENRLLSTMLDHSISGPLQDMDFAEWIIQMKGLYVRGAVNYDGTAIKRLVIGRVGERALSLSHLQQAILAKNNWAVDLILAATQGRDLQYREGKEDNSAIHLAVLARVMRNLREIMMYDGRCDEDPRQDEFWSDDDPLKRDRMKATVALMVDELHEDYMKRGEALQLLQEKRTLTAKKGKVNHRRGGRGEEEELVIAREEWKRAADAEMELLASEEIEKANEEARKGNGGTKQKKGGKKKK